MSTLRTAASAVDAPLLASPPAPALAAIGFALVIVLFAGLVFLLTRLRGGGR